MASISGLRSTLTTLKWVLFAAIVYFFVLPLIPGFRNAVAELSHVTPSLLFLGLALEMAALFAYSMLTHAVLGSHHQSPSVWRLFRIQMSTKAVGNILPGGSAAPRRGRMAWNLRSRPCLAEPPAESPSTR